jgi:hypothetical protein
MEKLKLTESLAGTDFLDHPVWMYVGSNARGETLVRPVKRLPVRNLGGKIVGTKVRLGNGSEVWAVLENIQPEQPRMTEHYLQISVERDGQWFHLARYFDYNYDQSGPEALARFLELAVDEVFPIAYDVRQYATGDPTALAGVILKEPRERLTLEEVIAMAVEQG